jgi:hypothetical protein
MEAIVGELVAAGVAAHVIGRADEKGVHAVKLLE